ncbi:terpenoid synthase [Thelephora ganbajun]|uniref:Terpenoid synthase n=1 Tax=Thelephora ganbajun TaxID=370292 RepID=A0ACB6ZY22_THEGA|nr:terpenoid synthase [Thelephora ganbajun]
MYFTLPDLPGICQDPFSPSFNPHYEAVASESKVWIDSLGILSGEKQRYFSTSAFEFLAAYTYPYADREGYRTCCDYLNVTFILDDYSDDEGEEGARQMADSFMNALRDPTWDDRTPFARMSREFGGRLTAASATARQRFIDTFDHYLDATVHEAKNREQGTVLGLSDYLELRRGNSGVYPAYAVIECILSIDLQPGVFNHPALWNLTKIAGDMLFTANDIYSYNKEQAGGHSANNLVTVIQQERGVDLQGAMDIAGDFLANYADEFNMWKDRLPSWGPEVDAAVSEYVKGMAACVRGYIEWSLSGPRYFGSSVEEVKKTRRVLLAERVG